MDSKKKEVGKSIWSSIGVVISFHFNLTIDIINVIFSFFFGYVGGGWSDE